MPARGDRLAKLGEPAPRVPRQTRACRVGSKVAFDAIVLAKGLERPWARAAALSLLVTIDKVSRLVEQPPALQD